LEYRFRSAKRHKKETKSFNAYLDTLQNQFYDAHSQLTESKSEITAETLKSTFLGKGEKIRMLMDIFREHNKKIKTLVGKEYAAGTAIRYQTLGVSEICYTLFRGKTDHLFAGKEMQLIP